MSDRADLIRRLRTVTGTAYASKLMCDAADALAQEAKDAALLRAIEKAHPALVGHARASYDAAIAGKVSEEAK